MGIKKSIKRKLDKDIKKIIKKREKIGSGKNRVIYDLRDGYVLKVVRCKSGIKHNKHEIKIYRSSGSSIKKYLAKIKDYGKLWLIMKKYDEKFPKSKKYKNKLEKLKSKFREKGIDPKDMFNRRRIVKLSATVLP